MSKKVYIVMSAELVVEKLKEYIDDGRLSEANSLSYDLKSFYDSVKAYMQNHGATVLTHLYERSISECSLTAAEDFPNIAEAFGKKFGTWIAIGMGFSLREASEACRKSAHTGEIELFGLDSLDESHSPERNFTTDDENDRLELPPNLFDPSNPPSPESQELPDDSANPPGRLSLEQDLKGQQALIQQYLPQPAPQPQQPGQQQPGQQQPGQEQQQQAPQEPRDLLEALNGGPVPGRQPEGAEQAPKADAAEQVEKEVDEAEHEAEAFDDKLAERLALVRQQIPQIMGLAEKNPSAFKQAMGVVKQLIGLARSRRTQKSEEFEQLVEELNKVSMHYPVGTTHKGKRKVLVNGKAYWRSVRAGQLLDAKGNAISVRSSNLKAQDEDPNN